MKYRIVRCAKQVGEMQIVTTGERQRQVNCGVGQATNNLPSVAISSKPA